MTVTLPGLLDTLNPLLSSSAAARAVAALVFPHLVAATPDGQFLPSLATGWTSSDGLTWTFRLDPTRRWQDGAAVTSADVGYTIGLIQAADSPVDPAWHVAWQGVRVLTPDSATVVLTVPARIGAGVLDMATVPLLPAHVLASTPAHDLSLLPFASHPIGSGAYRVTTASSQGVTLQSTGRARLAPEQVRIHLGNGSAPEGTPGPPGSASVRLLASDSASPGASIAQSTLARPVFAFLNTRDPLLSDVRVRRALAMAIDRSQLVTGPLQGHAVPLHGPVSPGLWESVGAATMPAHDSAAAARLLQDAGWNLTGGSERERAAVPLALTLLVDSDPQRLAVAQAVAADWQAIGIKTTVEVVGLDGLLRDFALPGRYQAALIGISQRGVLPDLTDLWHSGGGLNISGWADPLADAALDATLAANLDVQQTGYERFAQRFADEVPAIPLYVPTVRFAVRGLQLSTSILNAPADVLLGAADWRAAP